MGRENSFSLEGRHALITGGATGIGLGIAEAMVAAGGTVTLSSRNRERLEEACRGLGPKADFRVMDVVDYQGAKQVIEDIEGKRPIDILVNNAGIHLKKPGEEISIEEFQNILDVHILGAHNLSATVGSHMLKRRRGTVIYIASMASLFGIPYVTAYAAAKTAMLGIVRTLASEWGDRGVRVNAIAPGWIDSAMMRKAFDNDNQRKEKVLGRTPLGRFGEAEDIGNTAVFLASEAAKFITGACLPVDGGASIGF